MKILLSGKPSDIILALEKLHDLKSEGNGHGEGSEPGKNLNSKFKDVVVKPFLLSGDKPAYNEGES